MIIKHLKNAFHSLSSVWIASYAVNFLDCRAENSPSSLSWFTTNKGLRAEMAKLLLQAPENVEMEL